MLAKNQITALFENFKKLNILVIGDVMLDSYVWGKVERLSPEAPVPIVSVTKRENRLGGAANVAINIQSLGAKPIICSVIGNDEKGKDFTKLLIKQRLSREGLIVSKNRITTTKFRVMGNNSQLLRVDEEVENNITPEESNLIFHKINNIIKSKNINAIIFEDYDKGVINSKLIQKVVSIAKTSNIIITADPKKKNFSDYKHISLFKPNLKEIKEGLKLDIDAKDINALKKAARILHIKQDINIVLLTLAAQGVFVSYKVHKVHKIISTKALQTLQTFNFKNSLIPSHKRNISDVSGAGDTVISTATLCLAAGLSPIDSAIIANLAGGLVCEQIGAVPIDKHILKKAILTDLRTTNYELRTNNY